MSRSDSVKAAIAGAVQVTDEMPTLEPASRPRRKSAAQTTAKSQPKGAGAGPADIDAPKLRECAALDANDRDNGRRLLNWFGDDMLYVSQGPGWHEWAGTHWQPDPGDLRARALAQLIVDKIKLEPGWMQLSEKQRETVEMAAPLRKKPPAELSAEEARTIKAADEAISALEQAKGRRRQFAISSGNSARTEAMLRQAAAQRNVKPDVLDKDQLRLNVANGTLVFSREPDPDCPDPDVERHVGKVMLVEHTRSDLITRVAEVAYDPLARCPRFKAFLDRVQPRPDMQLFLQVAHGYAGLIGGNGEQRLLYHFGRGANGKSAFMETLGRLLGGYRAVTSPDSLVGQGQRQGNQQNSDMARLFNARLVTVEELPRGEPLKENLIKQLTGGSRFVARFLNREFFEFDPTFTAIMAGNDMPTIGGTDYGIWRRLLIVPWRVEIPEAERIPFGDLLASFDEERPGILNWLIDGALKWLGSGLLAYVPPEVSDFTSKHREDRDILGNFVAAYIERSPNGRVQAKRLLDAFTAYCEQNGIKPWHQATFGSAMKAMGFEKEHGRHVYYVGLNLVDPPDTYDPATPSERWRGEP